MPTRAPLTPRTGKGSRHVSRCGGPFSSAMDAMPPVPPTGARRARAGLAGVPITSEQITAVKVERAARCLTSILPQGAAAFILHDTTGASLSKAAWLQRR